ncbi:DUF3886 domain-containing protein [Brevibacillus daliensis]|uniref:DUF3886 domain-containing protein n=1 Tax=Brevibacillus daliensis TaxID=2892995 RepID=UPI001E414B4B|nr:DUF3886 domain-containing protein [Brevibacillus daliensis]
MAKKRGNRTQSNTRQPHNTPELEQKSGNSLKDMLGAAALDKLKQMEKQIKATKEQEEQAEKERRIKEKEEREKNKSFAELLADYDKKGSGKYS